ncbi:MAG TPA: hypothetical protein ENJ06_01790 [Phycisphaeraceae bacterium]|nr:hypothetical protein [Phycisphaeraceae bacterium]
MKKMLLTALLAGGLSVAATAQAADDVVLESSADSYNWIANQPHGELPFMALWQEVSPNQRQAVAMMKFDLGDLGGLDSSDVLSARIELHPWYASHQWELQGDAGRLVAAERLAAFDESDPNPLPSSGGTLLTDQLMAVDNYDLITIDGPALLDAVRDWMDNPASNMGIDLQLLAPAGADDTFYMALYSREADDPSLRPRLVLNTTSVPAPGVGTLMGIAGLSLVSRRRRA